MKHALIVVLTTAALFFAHTNIAGYAQAFSIELTLRSLVSFGQYQTLLGEFFAGIALGVLASIGYSALRLESAVSYIFLSSLGVVAVSFAIVPTWPSHNAIRVLGEITLLATIVSVAWVVLRGLAVIGLSAGRTHNKNGQDGLPGSSSR